MEREGKKEGVGEGEGRGRDWGWGKEEQEEIKRWRMIFRRTKEQCFNWPCTSTFTAPWVTRGRCGRSGDQAEEWVGPRPGI